MITHAVRRRTGILFVSMAVSAAGVVATPVASAATVKAGSLQRGDTGRDVKRLQRALGIPADGVYGPGTRRAVKAFQRAEGLPPTGRADARTLARLGLASDPRATKQTGTGGVSTDDERTAPTPIRLSRDKLAELQDALGVTADGEMGPQTRRAIRRHERSNGMVVDGRPDAVLLSDLGIDPDEDPAAEATGEFSAAIAAAESAIGTPYASGGTTTAGFDCSGLTLWAFKKAGVRLPRTSFDQYERGTAVDRSDIAAGDLVFFDTSGPGASHVGIATGAKTVISATTRGVMEHAIGDEYWGSHYIGAKRL